uniref:Macrophage-expressed gene 1 protein n=1 Tax=Sinocyclocheilus anshuiensis TaxID=1608454 RepID=A0A671R2H3_9TELE
MYSVTPQPCIYIYIYVNAYPDFTLDSRFAQQIGEVADANNQTRLATYLSEKLILDYVTHVITSVKAGAILVQEDYIKRSYISNSESDKSSASASAGINFFNKVNFNFGIQSHGAWGFILPRNHSAEMAREHAKLSGECVDPNSPNFNFQANLNDSSCKGPVTNLTFGGIYQKCTPLSADGNVICDELAQKNPNTGDYVPSAVHGLFVTLRNSRIFFDCCDNVCGNVYYIHHAEIDTYWCSTNQTVPQYSGYLFGGLFGPSLQNPQTKSHDCPPNYFAQIFLTNFGMRICLSNDYEAGTVSSVPFGGFFSCQSGNPLARDQYHCSPQHSQHIAAISDGCQILYCVQSGEFTGGQLKPIRLPPFTRPPLVNMMATNTVAVMTEGDRAWLRVGEIKKWRLAKPGEVNQIAGTFEASSTRMSGGEKAGVACGVMTFIAVLVAGIVILMKRRRTFSHFRSSRGYEEIHCDGQSGLESQREQQNKMKTSLNLCCLSYVRVH